MKARREGAMKGGYIAKKETAPLDLILLSAGSELQHALKAAETLGPGTRVVSIPCFSRFDRQSAEYRNEVLPSLVPPPGRNRGHRALDVGALRRPRRRLRSASTASGCRRPAREVMKELGITAEHVVEVAKQLQK